jgi:hypothetical protein
MSAADILLLLLTHAAAFFWGAAFADWTWRRMFKRGNDRNRVQR